MAGGGAGAVSAQEAGRIYHIGFMIPGNRQMPSVVTFFDELRRNGFVEGQNLTVFLGGFDVPIERIAEVAAALVKAAPDAIVGGPELQLQALQALTRTIPLIGITEDMVAAGWWLRTPAGGNTTGMSLLSPELDGKRQDILMEAVPRARRMAALADSNVTSQQHLQSLQDAARARGVELSVFGVSKPEEIAPAIDAAKAAGAEAINFLATPLFSVPGSPNSRVVNERIAALHLPDIFQWPETAEQGGLLGYGPRFNEMQRQRARMVVKILRGAKPVDIPVEQPTRFELVINLQIAKAIGHEIPAGLVLRADEVIE